MKRLTTKEFIEKSIKKYGEGIFDYSKTKYVNTDTKVTLKCKKHEYEFEQIPYTHLLDSTRFPCPICRKNYIGKKGRSNTKEFIQKSKEKYGENMFDYSKVQYETNSSDIILKCKKHSYEFTQKAFSHLNKKMKNPCPKCNNENSKKNNSDLMIQKSKEKYGENTFDYSKFEYIDYKSKTTFTCKEHDYEFEQSITNHFKPNLLYPCPKCRVKARKPNLTTEDFIKKSKNKYGDDFFDYSLTEYKGYKSPLKLKCVKHNNIFEQRPEKHLAKKTKYPCKKCQDENAKINNSHNTEDFIKKSIKKYGEGVFDYSEVKYSHSHERVVLTCLKHDKRFEINANQHLIERTKNCCPVNSNYSLKEIDWINSFNNSNIIKNHRIKIKNKYYVLDGYDPTTNTVYEFNGDYWHGNPKVFNSNDIHPHSNVTYGEMYKKTIKKENDLIKEGYKVISIWENEWDGENSK